MKILEKLLLVLIVPILTVALSIYMSTLGDFNWNYIIFTVTSITAINTLMLFLCPYVIPQANLCWLILGALVNCLAVEDLIGDYNLMFTVMSLIISGFTVLFVCLPDIVIGIHRKKKFAKK